MRKPKTFEARVEAVNRAPYSDVPWIYKTDAVKLLRQYHNRVVRMVKKQRVWSGLNEDKKETVFCTINKKDLLAALARMKGKS